MSAVKAIVDAPDGSQDDTLNRECFGVGQLVAGGELPEREAAKALQDAAARMPSYDPRNPWTQKDLTNKVERSFTQGMGEPREAPEQSTPLPVSLSRRANANNDGLPTIRLSEAEIQETVDDSEAALIAAGRGVYQRGGSIVGVAIDKGISANNGEVSFLRIEELGDFALVEDLSLSARYEKWDGRLNGGKGAWRFTTPPMWVVKTLRQRMEKRVPPLAGVINAPTMRFDGAIIDTPGYDHATGLLYDPRGVEFPQIPDSPTKEQAKAALEVIKAPIALFPFKTEVDRAVAISAIVAAVVRRTLRAAPAHTFTAPTAGSGKSKLVDIASVVATGSEAAVMSQGDNDEEFEKRLGTCVLDGRSVVAIDNCKRPLKDIDLLCSMLTQPEVSPRILGSSKAPRLPSNAFVTATGNNLVITGDLTRRSLLCEVDPQIERPELREFSFEPVEESKRTRPQMVAAALTILRAFVSAGCPAPEGSTPIGSFEDWSLLVRNALIWIGCADPAESMERLRADDPERAELADVLSHWDAEFGSEWTSTAEAINHASERAVGSFGPETFLRPGLRDALLSVAGRGGTINSRALGRWLMHRNGRIIDGRKFQSKSVSNSAQWKISRA